MIKIIKSQIIIGRAMLFLLLLLLATPVFTDEVEQPLFTTSVIVVKGENTSIFSKDEGRVRGTQVDIDWDKVPDLGVPKEEIFLIEVINRQNIYHNGSYIRLSPSEWRFTAPSWDLVYEGSIPYLENLAFLSENTLDTHNQIIITQNSLGYFQDGSTRLTGLFQSVNYSSDDTVSAVHILTAKENQHIYDMARRFDAQIISEELLNIQEKPAESSITPPAIQTEEVIIDEQIFVEKIDDNITKTPKNIETSVHKRTDIPN